MTKIYLFIAFITLFSGCTTTENNLQTVSDAPWVLVFEDDFEGTELDPDSWTAVERGAAWNNEDQAYISDNAFLEEGLLVLQSRRESWTGSTNLPWHPEHPGIVTRQYTSAQVETRGKRFWTYGRFEIRARMEGTPGMLNALWMVTESDVWPPEIDIAEVLGDDPHSLYTTNHYGTQSAHRKNGGRYYTGDDLSEDFHVYGVEWEPDEIRWFLDGYQVYSAVSGIPHEPFYLVLCPAIGPDWTGDPTSGSRFPLRMEVDWIRVYQRKEE